MAGAEEAASGEPRGASETSAQSVVVATIGNVPIYLDQVERELETALQGRNAEPAGRAALQAAILERLVNRELVLGFFRAQGTAASPQDIDLATDRLTRRLARENRTLADHCRAQGIHEDELRKVLEWQISWERFLERQLTDDNLQRYFQQHSRDFDGTRLRVAHILWKLDPSAPDEQRRTAVDEANRVREEIVADRLPFADAARSHSSAPSAESGGDIGFISRHDPMPESFSRAAFALQPREVSPPVVAPSGVHLITCLDVEPGKLPWTAVRQQLQAAATQHLFQWAASRQRLQTVVRYSGVVPVPPALSSETPGGLNDH